jgi:hypothetical protein
MPHFIQVQKIRQICRKLQELMGWVIQNLQQNEEESGIPGRSLIG